jgi:hypothetical protein
MPLKGDSDKEQSAYEELAAWTLGLGDAAFLHQRVVDAWAAQHATAKSKPINIAFALLGLYLHLEHGFSGREVQLAHIGSPSRMDAGQAAKLGRVSLSRKGERISPCKM